MTQKALPASIALLFVLSVPLVGADDEQQPFISVEGYKEDPDYYCIQVTSGIGSAQPSLCTSSPLASQVAPETGEIGIFMPDVWGPLDALGAPQACMPSQNEDWYIGGRVVCENEDIVVSHGMTVGSEGELVLRNSTLSFDYPEGEDETRHFAQVMREYPATMFYPQRPGGRLVVENSTITAAGDETWQIYAGFGSELVVTESHLEDFDLYAGRFQGRGLDSFGLEDSTLLRGTLSIDSNNTGPVQGNFMRDVRFYTSGQPLVTDNVFVDCSLRVNYGGAPHVTHNTFSNCYLGQRLDECSQDMVFRSNDVLPTWPGRDHYVAGCGDFGGNYWGLDSRPFLVGEEPTLIEERSEAPWHPERLPRPVVTLPESIVAGDILTWDASDSHPSRQYGFPITSVAWRFGGPPVEGERVEHVFQGEGPIRVTMKVTDEAGLSRAWTETVHVLPGSNRAPVVDSVFIEPTTAYAGDALYADVHASDPDGEDVNVAYYWYRDNQFVERDVHDPRIPEGMTEAGEVWHVMVVPDDGRLRGDAAWARASIHEEGANAAPYFQVLQIQVNRSDGWQVVQEARPGEALYADVEVRDSDGDAVELSYRWLRDDDQYGFWDNGSFRNHTERFVTAGVTQAGEVWEVVVTATDGEHSAREGVRVQIQAAGEESAQSQAVASNPPVGVLHDDGPEPGPSHAVPAPGLAVLSVLLAAVSSALRRRRP